MHIFLSWSTGKDAAWALHALRRQGLQVAGLITTLNEAADRVAMHGVRRTLAKAQAEAAGLPLRIVNLPWPCSNADYEVRMAAALADLKAEGATHIAFGDLFLEDVRAYRERQVEGADLKPLFPLWHPCGGTEALAHEMLEAGLEAVLTCVDPGQIPPSLTGRAYDRALLADLPAGADPCGERGEFHTFCHGGPMFAQPILVRTGRRLDRGGFRFTDVLPQG